MRNLVRYGLAGLLLVTTLMLSTAFSFAAKESITSKQFLEILYELTDCTTIDELVEQHYINTSEANLLRTKYPYAAMVQRVLPPLFGVYPYPNELYPVHPTWAVGDTIYQDAAVALWSMGWESRSYWYTAEEVNELIAFLKTHKLNPPINSQFDVDITRENYSARNSLMRAWENIPQKHKDYMEDNGWKFEYHTTNATGKDWNDCTGVTNYNQKTIYLFECNEGTVYHEMGHMLTKLGNTDSIHDTLYDLEAKRGQKFMREYALTSGDEFIACAFTEYFEKPDKLKKYCPLTYAYIDRVYYNGELACDIELAKRVRENPVATLIQEVVMP